MYFICRLFSGNFPTYAIRGFPVRAARILKLVHMCMGKRIVLSLMQTQYTYERVHKKIVDQTTMPLLSCALIAADTINIYTPPFHSSPTPSPPTSLCLTHKAWHCTRGRLSTLFAEANKICAQLFSVDFENSRMYLNKTNTWSVEAVAL